MYNTDLKMGIWYLDNSDYWHLTIFRKRNIYFSNQSNKDIVDKSPEN